MKTIKKTLSVLLAVITALSMAITGFAASYIGDAKAKEIALKDAGVSASNAKYLTCQFDHDDGRAVYDVEFYNNKVEYNYEIDAKSGKILSIERDGFVETVPAPSAEYITKAQAKEIAFKNAKVSEADAKRVRVTFEFDDGRAEYQVEFHADKYDYDYEIDAVSGKILSVDRDRQFDVSDLFFARMFSSFIAFIRNIFA